MKKRALVLFTLLLFILSGVVLQVYRLSDAYLSQAADQQGSVTVKVANSRGTIYDARLRPLTNAGEEYRLSVTPSPEAIAALSGMLDEEQLAAVSERLQSGKPAVVTLPEIPANLEGSLLFKVPVRYGGRLLAPHLLGYMDGDGLHGLTGVELAFDEYLNSCGGQASVTYSVDAMGKPLQGIAPQVVNTLADAKAGVVLTIDQDIQKIAEEAAKRYMTKGAVVVMEPATMPSAVGCPPYSSKIYSGRDPALIPMRIGIFFSLAIVTTLMTFSLFPIFPGLIRSASIPDSIAVRARR